MKQAITSNLFKIRTVLLRMLVECTRSYIKSLLRYNFKYWLRIIRTHYIYASKDVRIRGYFSKPKGFREQKVWETLSQAMEIFKVTVVKASNAN
jgi:hypothetical protein